MNNQFKVKYHGSFFWLIFWFIFFFPIAIELFFTSCTFTINKTIYYFNYDGSRFWLGFWTLVFFPVAFLLLILNGFSIRAIPENMNH
jgi:hypothetical protein